MKNQQQVKKEGFKIVSRPSNEEIEDDEDGYYHSKEERNEEQAKAQHKEDGTEGKIIDIELTKEENNTDTAPKRLDNK